MNAVRFRRPVAVIAVASVIAVMALASSARAADGDAGAFITQLGDQTLALIQARNQPNAEREQKFAQIAEQGFDIPKIARYVLGRYWLTASPDQQQQFVAAFQRYMVEVYWQRFASYTGATFKVLDERQDAPGLTTVTTEVARSDGDEPAKINWSVQREGSGYKISDVSIEGISQALTYRQEFSSIMERNNGQVSALIADLRQKASG